MAQGARAVAPALLAAVAALCIGACRERAPVPEAPSPRLVSLTPSLTEIVEGLGEGEHLVGTTKWADRDDARVVGGMRPNPEQVVAVRPDLVVAGRYASTRPTLEDLRARDLEVLALPLETFDEVRAATRTLGRRLGAEEEASAQVAALDEALADARRRRDARGPHRPRTLLVFEVGQGHVYTTGGEDHLGELLDAVGADNVAERGPLTTRLSFEQVVELAPELIVHVAPNERFPNDEAARRFWASMPSIPAVERGAVQVWPDDALARQGPQLPRVVRRLSRLVEETAQP